MILTNRIDAGRQLAKLLKPLQREKDVVVLGIPRGGVPVAGEIARALHAPLDVFLSHKLGVPGQEELAFGAVAAGDGRFLDQEVIRAAGITPEQIEEITASTRRLLEERAAVYRHGQPPLDVTGKTVILVDDGIATGASVFAALHALRLMKPRGIIVATPVAPRSTCAWLQGQADMVVTVFKPAQFYAVGQFYQDFRQVTDEEVTRTLEMYSRPDVASRNGRSEHNSPVRAFVRQQEVEIPIPGARLTGTLAIPEAAQGVILFAHGSGSSRHSPRNQAVAKALQARGFATLLFDLLTEQEENADKASAAIRFNVQLLASRLLTATQWIQADPRTTMLPIGYFGASTGAAAAIVAAAELGETISAVVSRGGRPDLAGDALRRISAATLLIVGGYDSVVLELNRAALEQLHCPSRMLWIVPGATHLFEEPGALEQVADHAGDWFSRHVGNPSQRQIQLTGINHPV